MFELNFLITLYDDAKVEVQHYALNYYRMMIGFWLCKQFINTQSLLDWSISLSFVDLVLTRTIQYGLESIIPEQLSYLYQNTRLSELLSLSCLSYFFQQSLLVLILSRTLYYLFYFFCQIFSRQPIQTLLISYYLNNILLVFPLLVKIILSCLFMFDSFLSLQICKNLFLTPLLIRFLSEFGITESDLRSLSRIHINRHDDSYQYQEIMLFQKSKIDSVLEEFNYQESLSMFRQLLIQRYHDDPAVYLARDGQLHDLPLDWQHLTYFLVGKDRYQVHEILKAYYQHPIHTVYRMIQAENPWGDKSPEMLKRHAHYTRKDYLQWFIYFWLEEQSFLQTDKYLHSLAHLYRLGNQEKKIQARMQISTFDNLLGDLPGNEESIQSFILGYLETSTQVNILTETKLKVHLHQFIKHVWEKRLMTLSSFQFSQFRDIWKNIMEQNAFWFMFSDNYQGLELNLDLKKTFEAKILALYGDILSKSPEFCEIIDSFFTNKHQHDVEHHAIAFNQAISNVSRALASH